MFACRRIHWILCDVCMANVWEDANSNGCCGCFVVFLVILHSLDEDLAYYMYYYYYYFVSAQHEKKDFVLLSADTLHLKSSYVL